MNAPPSPSLFQPYLLSGERVAWTGTPKQGFALGPQDTFLIPFSLLWGGFAIFWNIGVWTFYTTDGADAAFKLFGLPFLIVGLYLIVGRFFHDAAIRKHIQYGVTDQRVVILSGVFTRKFSSFDLRRLPKLELTEHRDGTGTLVFEGGGFSFFYPGRYGGMDWWLPSLGSSSQFYRIDDPRKVYELIRDASARS